MVKQHAKRLAHALGFEVKKWRWSPSYLARLARPGTVVDVGAGYGTPELHRAFPGAHFCLVEPVEEYAPYLEKLARTCDCCIHYRAVGSRAGALEIQVDPHILTRTSFAARTDLTSTGASLRSRQVEVVTLDQLRAEHHQLPGPILLKIDTEGFELEVIKGGDRFLQETATVIAEVSIGPRFVGGYCFEELVRAMDERGFAVHDILRVSYVRGGTGARFADIVFQRRPGPVVEGLPDGGADR